MAEIWTPGKVGAPLAPPGFVPQRRIIGHAEYIKDHPTRYRFAKHLIPLIRYLYREMGGPTEIHIDTYVWHPPYDEPYILRRYDLLSFDVWGGGGRGDPIGFRKGTRVFDLVWDYPGEPYIDWAIWERRLYSRARNFVPIPWGTNPFTWHDDHPHFSMKPRGFFPASI